MFPQPLWKRVGYNVELDTMFKQCLEAGLVRVRRLSPAQNQGSTIADRTFASPLIVCYATTRAGGTL
jgi:hypothetical protein